MVAQATAGANRDRRGPAILRPMAIDPVLLDILVCPRSKASLREVDGALVSTDPETRMRYRIEDGIPVMLVEEGEQMTRSEWAEAMAHG